MKCCIYNNCLNEGRINGVEWRKLDSRIFEEKFDVLIVNRGDKFLNFKKECKKRIFWIHNPAKYLLKYRYLTKLFFNKFKIVFSSNFSFQLILGGLPLRKNLLFPMELIMKLFCKKIRLPSQFQFLPQTP